MNEEALDALKRISPNLKLGGEKLLPVLERIQESQPDRERVSDEVMKEFPGKSSKSVFRGMVVPTLTRFHLARSISDKKTVFLAPNGRAAVHEAPRGEEILKRTIEDYSVLDRDLFSEAFEYFHDREEEIEEEHKKLHSVAERYWKDYLDHFSIVLPPHEAVTSDPFAALYSESLRRYIRDSDLRREWLRGALIEDKLYQMEEARWQLLRWIMNEDHIVTSWFVDEALRREWQSGVPILNLWKGSVRADTKLLSNGRYYDALVLTGD